MSSASATTGVTVDSPLVVGPAPLPVPSAPTLQYLQEALYECVLTRTDKTTAVKDFLGLAARLTNATATSYFIRDGGRGLVPFSPGSGSRLATDRSYREQLAKWCADACRVNAVQVHSTETRGEVIVCLPVTINMAHDEVLVSALQLDGVSIEPFVVMLQLVATHITLWHQHHASKQLDWEARTTAAMVELQTKIVASDDLASAYFHLVNELQRFVGCDQVAYAAPRPRGAGCVLRAVSGHAEFDHQSELLRLVEAAANEAVVRDALTAWPPVSPAERHTTLAHRKLVDRSQSAAVLSHPLRTVDGQLAGAVVFQGRRESLHQAQSLNAIQASGIHIAGALDVVRRAHAGPVSRLGDQLRGKRTTRNTRRTLIAVAVIVVAVLLFPYPYKVASRVTVEPAHRRFAVIPYDGQLKECLVRPGDVVTRNQVLARMDDREMRWELSSLIADRSRAAKQRDTSMAGHDVAAAQMAGLEVERLELKIRLLEHREANLEIKSPLAGVILDGELDDAQGVPVKIGQSLYEIAPLNPLKMEVAVPEEDVGFLEEGAQVSARLDGAPGKNVRGTVSRIHPRAEIRESRNVFLADVDLDNPDRHFRPGMRGDAKVIGAPYPRLDLVPQGSQPVGKTHGLVTPDPNTAAGS